MGEIVDPFVIRSDAVRVVVGMHKCMAVGDILFILSYRHVIEGVLRSQWGVSRVFSAQRCSMDHCVPANMFHANERNSQSYSGRSRGISWSSYLDWRDELQPLEQEDPPPRHLQLLSVYPSNILPQLSIIDPPSIEAVRCCAPAMRRSAVEDTE